MYIPAQTVCEVFHVLAATQPGSPMTVILDNARYQRYALVQAVAQE
jgi:hypothetical protein